MRTFARLLLVCGLLLISAHRLPAPIQEENPTPVPEKSAKPKPERTAKPKVEKESSTKPRQSSSVSTNRETANRNPFDGTWSGYLTGQDDYRTLFINGHGSVISEKSTKYGNFTWQPANDGVSLKWSSSGFGWGCSCIFIPNSDGKTAAYTASCSSILGTENWSVVFQKTSTATVPQTSAPVVTNSNAPAPVAKAVPDRPGFVYNPFDPNSHILLDVRGKPSGTKLIEPKSGRLFVVP